MDEESWRKTVAHLCYTLHGGSGFSFTHADVLGMTLSEINYYLEWLDSQRTEEFSRIKAAQSGK